MDFVAGRRWITHRRWMKRCQHSLIVSRRRAQDLRRTRTRFHGFLDPVGRLLKTTRCWRSSQVSLHVELLMTLRWPWALCPRAKRTRFQSSHQVAAEAANELCWSSGKDKEAPLAGCYSRLRLAARADGNVCFEVLTACWRRGCPNYESPHLRMR